MNHQERSTGITKRQLGIGFALAGAGGALLPFARDWLGAASYSGVGPTQRLILIACGFLFLVGLTLIPLGDRPA
ncbi:MAG: hypothetical protein H6650_16995 [Ardenticatenales bacterium]|nr:hypothetical protein [Ardenticatenales bacterium]